MLVSGAILEIFQAFFEGFAAQLYFSVFFLSISTNVSAKRVAKVKG